MKNILAVVLGVLVMAAVVDAADLQVGMTASDWSFKDADGNVFTMDSWKGRVLLINYVDPDESDLNEHLTDAMKKAKEEGRLKEETYEGIGIADCAETWKPNFAIRLIAGKKAEKHALPGHSAQQLENQEIKYQIGDKNGHVTANVWC